MVSASDVILSRDRPGLEPAVLRVRSETTSTMFGGSRASCGGGAGAGHVEAWRRDTIRPPQRPQHKPLLP